MTFTRMDMEIALEEMVPRTVGGLLQYHPRKVSSFCVLHGTTISTGSRRNSPILLWFSITVWRSGATGIRRCQGDGKLSRSWKFDGNCGGALQLQSHLYPQSFLGPGGGK